MSAAFEVNDLDIYTDAPVLEYDEAKELPVVKELERRARAWCLATHMQYDPADIVVAQLPTGNVAILTKLGMWKQKGRRRVRGPYGRWEPNYEWVYDDIVWIEKQFGTEYDESTKKIRLMDKSRFVSLLQQLVVSEKELAAAVLRSLRGE